MTKREFCQNNPAVAYYSGFGGFEIHGVEDDYIYGISGAWGNPKNRSFHRLKVNYDGNGNPFFRLHGYKCRLDECIRMGV